jgi:hypothetical protein
MVVNSTPISKAAKHGAVSGRQICDTHESQRDTDRRPADLGRENSLTQNLLALALMGLRILLFVPIDRLMDRSRTLWEICPPLRGLLPALRATLSHGRCSSRLFQNSMLCCDRPSRGHFRLLAGTFGGLQ